MKRIVVFVILSIFTSATMFAANMAISEEKLGIEKDLVLKIVAPQEIGCQEVSINSSCGEFCVTICVSAGTTWAQFNQVHNQVTAYFNARCIEP